MATSSPAVPADRFFARLEKFQLACPSCGRVITSDHDAGRLSGELLMAGHIEKRPKHTTSARRTVKVASQLAWNPLTQRLRCPYCRNRFVAGLILYPAQGGGGAGLVEAPPDTAPTPAERRELRRLAEGWISQKAYRAGKPVNLYVPEACSCPPKGWASDCRLHGTPPAEAEPLP